MSAHGRRAAGDGSSGVLAPVGPGRRWAGAAAAALASAALLGSCDSRPPSPDRGGSGSVAVVAQLPSTGVRASRQAALQEANRVRVELHRASDGRTVVDRTLDFDAGEGAAELSIQVSLDGASVRFDVDVEVRRGDDALFRGSDEVTLRAGRTTSAEVELEAVPSGVVVRNEDPLVFSALGASTQGEADVVFATGDPIPGFTPEWATRDAAVATVSGGGLITAEATGETHVVASFGGFADSTLVRVEQEVASLEVTPDSASVPEGESRGFEADARDANGNPVPAGRLSWTSSDTAVAAVDSSGLARARDDGTARVVASAPGVADTSTLVVTQRLSSVVVTPDSAELGALGETVRFEAAASDLTGDPIPVASFSWSSTAPEVATVDGGGLATARDVGTAGIVASHEGMADTADLVVRQEVASLEVTPDSASVPEGDSIGFEADARDANGNPVPAGRLSWTSSDTGVAAVDSSGLARARDDGTARVVASAPGVADTSTLVVTQRLSGLDVTPDTALVDALEETVQYEATYVDRTGDPIAGGTFEWTAVRQSVGTVDSEGRVTAQGNGVTRIIASGPSRADTALFAVHQTVDSVDVTPDSLVRNPDEEFDFDASAFDSNGFLVAGAEFSWVSTDTTVATVSSNGSGIAENTGSTSIVATAEGVSDSGVLDVVFFIGGSTKVGGGFPGRLAAVVTGASRSDLSARSWDGRHGMRRSLFFSRWRDARE